MRRRPPSGTETAPRCRTTRSSGWPSSASSAWSCRRSTAATAAPCSTRSSSRRSWPRSAVPPRSRCSRPTSARAASSSSSVPSSRRRTFLPKTVSGEITMAIGISEPDAGSAATDMRTKARLDGDEYVLNGSKRWISNGGHAERLPRLLPAQRRARREGHRRDPRRQAARRASASAPARSSWASAASPRADLYFDDVRVPCDEPRHRGRRVQAAVRGVLHRAPRQRDDEPRDRPGVPGPHQGLRAGA